MRNYLYCFFDAQDGSLHASGLEFKDIASSLCRDKITVLLKHDFGEALYHPPARLDYVTQGMLDDLLHDDIQSYGDFACFTCDDLESLQQTGVLADLLYFAHMGRFEHSAPIQHKQMFYWSHDDGWLAHIYSAHAPLKALLADLCQRNFPSFDQALFETALENGDAVWIDRQGIKIVPADNDTDKVLAQYL